MERGRIYGRLLVTTTTQPEGAPLLDGASSRADATGDATYGSLVLRRPGSNRALVIGWRGARVPWLGRWRPRMIRRRLEWRRKARTGTWVREDFTDAGANPFDNV